MAGYGYRFPTRTEVDELWERFEEAIEREKPVTVSFFKEKDITHTRTVHGTPQTVTYKGYVKVTRIVEPWLMGFHQGDGHPYVRVVSRSPTDEKGPFWRTIRLDRIAVSNWTGKPLMTVNLGGKRYCQPEIDYATERERLRALAHQAN